MGAIAAMRMAPVLAGLLRAAAGLGAVGLVVFLAFKWGQSDQEAEYEKAITKITKAYATAQAGAVSDAFTRGAEAARIENENEDRLDDIVRAAEALPGAHDLCVPADIVERLRQLQ